MSNVVEIVIVDGQTLCTISQVARKKQQGFKFVKSVPGQNGELLAVMEREEVETQDGV